MNKQYEDYKRYLENEIQKANDEWKNAMAEDNYDKAFIAGKRASDLEKIYYYHYA